jgi:hypothetical protein
MMIGLFNEKLMTRILKVQNGTVKSRELGRNGLHNKQPD